MTTLGMHWVPYFTDIGFTPDTAVLAVTVYGLFALVARMMWGFLAERFHVRHCLIAMSLGAAAGMFFLMNIRSPTTLFAYAAFHGLTLGGYPVLNPLTWAQYFGRTFLGTIRGVVSPLSLIASGGGPLLAGLVYDETGSYLPAFWVLLVAWLLCALTLALARPPGEGPRPGSSSSRSA